jgi:FMN reductase
MSKIQLVSLSGNLTAPSRTRALVDHAVEEISRRLDIVHTPISIAELAPDLAGLIDYKKIPPRVAEALKAIAGADLLVVGSPVYKGSFTGLFKHLIDFVDPAALTGVPVLLTATGGTDRHALVIEHQLRPLFAFFKALTLPTGVFALDVDFENYRLTRPEVAARLSQAADEAAALVFRRVEKSLAA